MTHEILIYNNTNGNPTPLTIWIGHPTNGPMNFTKAILTCEWFRARRVTVVWRPLDSNGSWIKRGVIDELGEVEIEENKKEAVA